MKRVLQVIACVVLPSGVVFVIWLFFFLVKHGIILTPDGEVPDMGLTGQIGDFVGGVVGTAFSFVATLFVIITLLEQNRQNKRNLFVQSYYEMLHVHINNVRQMVFYKSNQEVLQGRAVFSQLIRNYNTIYETVERFVKNILNGGCHGKSFEKDQISYLSDGHNRESLTMRLAYGYFLYGSDYYRLRNYKAEIEKTIEQSVLSIGKTNQFYVEGCHVILGHYFRHMFQMIQFIVNSDSISEDERYTYAKQLRAQMDDDEQLLLYYDAMSEVGVEWVKSKKKDEEICEIEQLCPMARFRMIKNIPKSVEIKGIQPEVQFIHAIDLYKEKKLDFFEQR